MQSHVKYTIEPAFISLNQLRKQGLNVSELTQVFMALVVARFQYALPALAGPLPVDDLHKLTLYLIKFVDGSLYPILQIQLIQYNTIQYIYFDAPYVAISYSWARE